MLFYIKENPSKSERDNKKKTKLRMKIKQKQKEIILKVKHILYINFIIFVYDNEWNRRRWNHN